MPDFVRTPPPQGYPGKLYVGFIAPGPVVYVSAKGSENTLLKPRFELHRFHHCRAPFDWGRLCGGAMQLALAMVADAYQDDEAACRLYRPLARAFVVPLEAKRPWWLTYDRLDAILAKIESEADEKRRFTEL